LTSLGNGSQPQEKSTGDGSVGVRGWIKKKVPPTPARVGHGPGLALGCLIFPAIVGVSAGFAIPGSIFTLTNTPPRNRSCGRHKTNNFLNGKFSYLPRFKYDASKTMSKAQKDVIRNFIDGEYLFRQGDDANTIFLVESGSVKIFKEANGNKIELSTLVEGEVIGTLSLLEKKELPLPRPMARCNAGNSKRTSYSRGLLTYLNGTNPC